MLKLFEVVDDPDNGELLLVLEYAEGGQSIRDTTVPI